MRRYNFQRCQGARAWQKLELLMLERPCILWRMPCKGASCELPPVKAYRIGSWHVLHSISTHAWAPGGCQRDASARAHPAVVQTCRVGRTHVALHKAAPSACLPCHDGTA